MSKTQPWSQLHVTLSWIKIRYHLNTSLILYIRMLFHAFTVCNNNKVNSNFRRIIWWELSKCYHQTMIVLLGNHTIISQDYNYAVNF